MNNAYLPLSSTGRNLKAHLAVVLGLVAYQEELLPVITVLGTAFCVSFFISFFLIL